MLYYPERFIGLRYLLAPKRDGFISIITILSFLGIFLGVGALIIVMSVMNGFRTELMKQLTGIRGHVVIQSYGGQIENYPALQQKITAQPDVLLALPTIEMPSIMIRGKRFDGVMLYGHDIEKLKRHDFLVQKINEGNLDDLQQIDTIMIGKRLAELYKLKLGDHLTLLNPAGEETMFGSMPKERDFKIVAIFELGMREHDKRFIFMSLENAQNFYGLEPNTIHNFELFTKSGHATPSIFGAISDHPELFMLEWRNADSALAKALNIEKNVMFVILSLMISIASLNIISGLVMLVKDKQKEIAILKSMGMSSASILRIFFFNGALIGVSGTLCGVILGLVFSANIERTRRFIEKITGTTLFNPEIYYLSTLPSIVNLHDVLMICGLSLSLALLATLYPAYKASKLDPAPILR